MSFWRIDFIIDLNNTYYILSWLNEQKRYNLRRKGNIINTILPKQKKHLNVRDTLKQDISQGKEKTLGYSIYLYIVNNEKQN